MKKIWNMLRGRTRRDNRGLSLVEVLCAVAILALVAGVIGTVIVVSTRTYRKGISETGIQQEAQLAANNIGNIVKDACSVVYGESGQQYIQNGSDLMTNSDTTPKMQVDGTTELSIITNEKIQYTVTYQRTDPADPHGRLFYQEFDSTTDSPISDLQIMANNIVDFSADTTDFKKSKTIKLKMTVEDEMTNRRIPMEYTMTSRNDAVEGALYVSHTDNVSILFPDGDIVLVPGETYQIPLVVAGTLTEGGLEWESAGGLTAGALTLDYAEVTVPVGTTATTETIVVHTKDKDEEGNYKAVASCNVIIRRVERVEVSHVTDTTNSQGGMYETVGTVYTFTASVSGNELVKHVAYDYDRNYKTAQAVAWSCVLKVNGTESTYNWTSVQNGMGAWEFTAPDFTTGAFAQYFEVDAAATKEDALVPSFGIKVKKTMPAGLKLTVRATSKHALGANKADSKYYDGLGSDPVNIYYGEDTIEPRETKLDQGLEIILEPHETGAVPVGMKGGVSSDVTFEYHDASDVRTESNTNGTIAVYNEADDTVEITLGKDEKGSGKTGAVPYTFTVDVKVSGVTKTTITVHVCRIDELSIEIPKDPWHDDKGTPMEFPTYDFRARLNVDNGNKDDMDKVVKNLIQYKPDGTLDEAAVRRTLSSKITWELIDHNSSFHFTESVTCMAGVGASDKGEIKGDYAKTYKKDGKEFYKVISVKPARVEQDGSGNWFIKQVPEIDISLSTKGTETGLPKGYELKVTIEALHPNGTNKTDTLYKEDVKASVSIFGEMTIETPTRLVIVEPGQGVNSTEASDKEIVVPIFVTGGEVYRMEATIDSSDRTSGDTKLALYAEGNPYKGGKTTSVNNKSTWYLGLLIGEDEKGNSDGRIKVSIDAYNTSGDKVGEPWVFELGVRRVDTVDIKVAGGKKMNAINKKDATMTLEAFPKGRGDNGTEFYNIQNDDAGSACRWEQKGHGEYKEPSPMEWTMVIKGQEKLLSEWTEYFVADTIKTSVDESDHKATVTFKLKKMIPYGSKIRAYSLHARGNNGKNETSADYVKYNKSGKKYANTYGELTIVDDGFQRADEFTFVENIANMRQGFGDAQYASDQCSFFRYRIKNGTWSPYYQLEDKSPQIARFIGTKESLVFLPENDYDVDIINVVYSRSKKLIYWPLDETLLEDGKGWKEEGFRLWNGDEIMKNSNYSGTYKDQMIANEHALYEQIKNSKEQWQWMFEVPKISINFEIGTARAWKVKDNSVTLATMSASSPLHLQGGSVTQDWIPGDEIAVELAPTSFCLWKRQFNMNAYVDQKVNGQWQEVAVTESGWQGPCWYLQTSCPQFQIYNVTYKSKGEYRIRTLIKDMEWMKINGRLFDRTYEGYKMDAPLFDLTSGEGVLYVNFN